MTVSWQTVRPSSAAAARPDEPGDQDELAGDGPGSEDTEDWLALPHFVADGHARMAFMRDLALRALI